MKWLDFEVKGQGHSMVKQALLHFSHIIVGI